MYYKIMLTKQDIELIGEVVDQTVEKRVEPLGKELVNLSKNLADFGKQLKVMNRKLNRVAKDVSWMSKEFDTEIVQTRRRVDRIEKHLGTS